MIRQRILSVLWPLTLVAVAWALRAPLLQREQWNLDEGSTFTMAQQIREGAVLYRDAVDQRAPLVPYLKAAVFWVAGDWNVHAVHLLLALALGVSAFLIYDLARRLGHRAVGFGSAATFTLLAFGMPGPTDGFAAHTEWFLVFFSISGFWLFSWLHRRGRFFSGALIGLFFGAAMLCKQPALFDFLVMWVLLVLLAQKHPADRLRLLQFWLGSLVGVLALGAVTAVFFWQYGALRDAIYYAWTYNLRYYIPEIPRLQRLAGAGLSFRITFEFIPVLGILAIAGALLLAVEAIRSLRRSIETVPLLAWLILGWCAAGLGATMLSGRLYEHYGIQIIPGVSLASGWMLAQTVAWLRQSTTAMVWPRRVGWVLLAGVVTWAAVDLVKFSRKISPYNDPSHAELRTIVQNYSGPSDRIFVWGYFPDGYLITRRLPSTRFIYPNFLTGLIPWTNLDSRVDTRYAVVPGAWDDFWKDYRAHPPVVILDTEIRGYLKYPLLAQPRLRDEVIDHFAIVQRSTTNHQWMRVLRRLAEPNADVARIAAPIDETIRLHAMRIEGIPDVVSLTVAAPQKGADVTLRMGGRPWRRLAIAPGAPVEVTFFIRITDLATPDAEMVDAVLQQDGRSIQSPRLDIVRRLALEPQPAAPAPVIAHGIERVTAAIEPTGLIWSAEPRGSAIGWRTNGAFSLDFVRPEGMEVVTFDWLPPALRRGLTPSSFKLRPVVSFIPNDGSPTTLSLESVARGLGRETLTTVLPHGKPGRLRVQWAESHPAETVDRTVWIGELHGFARGPDLELGAAAIPPCVATTESEKNWSARNDGSWTGAGLSRFIYPRTRLMNSIVFDFGGADTQTKETSSNSDGVVMVEANFIHADGFSENMLSEAIQPPASGNAHAPHHVRISLPERQVGRIEIKFKPTEPTRANDAVYLSPLRVQGPGPDIVLSSQRVLVPVESSTSSGKQIREYVNGRWISHAPCHVVYPCPADLRTVDFGFGIEEGAYRAEDGSMRSNGIDVVAEFRDDSEQPIELFYRRLDPYNVPGDRGVQHAQIKLPGRVGRLVFYLRPGPNNDTAYDWSYLTDFTGETAPSIVAASTQGKSAQ